MLLKNIHPTYLLDMIVLRDKKEFIKFFIEATIKKVITESQFVEILERLDKDLFPDDDQPYLPDTYYIFKTYLGF